MSRFTLWTASAALCGLLMTAPAIAGHKANHNPGGGGGGGEDVTFTITITDNASAAEVAAGDGVESPGGTIEGLTEAESFETIELGSITTDSGLSVTDDYNSFEVCGSNENVNPIGTSPAIDALQIQHNHEIDEIVVVVGYSVDGHSYTLLL